MISEIDFKSLCPVEECTNNSTVYTWIHSNCGGYEKITNQGIIYCCKCGKEGLFTDWKFKCDAHDYKYASAQGLCHALSVIIQLDTKNQLFIAKLMKKVGEQFSNNRRDDEDDRYDDSKIICKIY